MSNQTDTETRFSLLEMDQPGGEVVFVAKMDEPTPVVVETSTSEPVRSDDDGYMGPGVSPEGAARAKEDEAAAINAGFSVAAPIYEIGSLVNQWGVDNFRASREEYDSMPTTEQACGKLAATIQAENRRDIVLPLGELRMLENGHLTRGTGDGMPPTERAITGIGTHVTPGGAGYLRKCPPALRATNVNHWCEANALKEDGRATAKALREWHDNGAEGHQPAPVMVPRDITLRTRVNGTTDSRETFAIVSPGYTAHDIDAIAEQIMTSDAIPADARADITYDGYRARIDVLFHTDVQPEKAVAGEIFKAGIMLKTADDGSGSIQIAAQVWRNLCLNLIIIDHAKDMVMRRSHRGNGIAEAVEIGIADAMNKVAHFATKWSEATVENVMEKYGLADMDALFRGLVFNKVVHVAGVKPDAMFSRLKNAWEAEVALAPDQRYSRSIVVNAVTRAAHSEEWRRWTDVEDLETTGGKLLYQPVWNVIVPESKLEALSY